MATIGSLSTTTSNSIGNSSLRGFGGLSSGLDRDSLIESMTYGTTSKITQHQQKKQQVEWQQAAVRSITDKMISFGNKYTSTITASTNLFNSNFWGRSVISASGANSKYVALSGSAINGVNFSIAAVKQLAQKATVSSSATVSKQALETGEIDVSKTFDTHNLLGKTIEFKLGYGEGSSGLHSIYLSDKASDGTELKYDTAEHIAESINKLLEQEEGDFSQYVKFTGNDETGEISLKADGKGNAVFLTEGTALQYLGLEADKENKNNLSGKTITRTLSENYITQTSFSDMINGKSLTFNYNGTSKSIKLTGTDDLTKLEKDLQTKLDEAFGKDRIKVELNGDKDKGSFSFTTVDPETKEVDKSSTLTLTSGSAGLMGAGGALNVTSGTSNRMSLDSKVVGGLELSGIPTSVNDKGEIVRNLYVVDGKLTTSAVGYTEGRDKTITIDENMTIRTLMGEINSKTDMTMSYQSATDKFTFTSKENGASGNISMDANVAAMFKIATNDVEVIKNEDGTETENAIVNVRGKDALINVKYEGSDEEITLRRDSNTFNMDGITVALKGTFGYNEVKNADGTVKKDEKGNVELVRDQTAEAIGITASVDTDKIINNIKSMIEEYNAIVDEVNTQLTTKHDSDYAPLTTEQKKELSETEVKNYEEKAKEGLLFGDSDLRMLSSALRTVMSGGLQEEFRKIGITTSSSYSDGGKLELDENKLRAALATDPDNVERLFTSTAGKNADGTATYNGLATNLKSVMYQYANPLGSTESKGVLVRKAGTTSSTLSLTENSYYKQLQQIAKQIASLQERLQHERDRYINQFTSLETLISQMNNQSSWLSSFA